MNGSKKRVQIFDIAKGLSIILMTISHYPFVDTYPSLLQFQNVAMVIKMPLFIFISGYLFSYKTSYKTFLFSKIDGLIKPLLSFMITIVFLRILLYLAMTDFITVKGIVSHINAFIGAILFGELILINVALWFIAALFLGQLTFATSLYLKSKNSKSNYVVLIVMMISLFIINNYEFHFYYLEYVPIFFTYLFLGFNFRKLTTKLSNGSATMYSNKMIVFPILFILSWVVLYFSDQSTIFNIYALKYNYHYLLVLSLLGIFSVLFLCRYIENIPVLKSIFLYCSKASFFILAFHVFIIDLYRLIFDLENYTPVLHTFLFLLNIVICCSVYTLLKKISVVRLFFYPLKTIVLNDLEKRFLESYYISKIIPSSMKLEPQVSNQNVLSHA